LLTHGFKDKDVVSKISEIVAGKSINPSRFPKTICIKNEDEKDMHYEMKLETAFKFN
jgi:hypothetical protein